MSLSQWPSVRVHDVGEDVGDWTVVAGLVGGRRVDISSVRGAQTQFRQLSWTDPFGPASASLVLPAVTLLDSPGSGDLWWMRPGAEIDITWSIPDGQMPFVLRRSLRWEGYLAGVQVSLSDDGGQMELVCKGALQMSANTVLTPEYPMRPWPFEWALWRAMQRCRTANNGSYGELRFEWPEWWDTIYEPDPDAIRELVPLKVSEGDRWTGLVTRSTGQYEDALAYMSDLLTSMQVERGRFTIELDPGRMPVLRFVDYRLSHPSAVIDAAAPGFVFNGGVDYESRADVVFGKGRDLTGTVYSGMRVAADGAVFYEPMAYNRASWPPTPDYTGDRLRRDVSLSFFEGMSEDEARRAARLYRRRFSAASLTGSVTLTTDPWVVADDGATYTVPRYTLRAGDRLAVRHVMGSDAGVVFYVTQANHDIESGVSTLSVDTTVRDYRTSEEVRLRGRDALTSTFSLATGRFNVSVADRLLPWNYRSGYIPKPSRALFKAAAGSADDLLAGAFPWEEWTKAHPPGDPEWKSCYVRIGPANRKLSKNWNNVGNSGAKSVPLLQLSQAGSALLFQMMAVDINGNVMRVPFHVSIYANTTVASASMPKLNNRGYIHPLYPDPGGVDSGPYPFFPNAFERVAEDGTQPVDGQFNVPAEGSNQIASFGNLRAPAGYWPKTPPENMWASQEAPTGLLSVEDAFSWNIQGVQTGFDPSSTENSFSTSGQFGVMIYCDSVWDEAAVVDEAVGSETGKLVERSEPVFFIGRVYRTPPGLQ